MDGMGLFEIGSKKNPGIFQQEDTNVCADL